MTGENTPAARGRSARTIITAALAAVGLGVLASSALFTDSATIGSNAFTNGTIDITTDPTTTALTAGNMAPGDSIYGTVKVSNIGTLPMRYAVTSSATNADTKAVFGHLGYNATDKLSLTTGVRYTKEHKDYTFVRLSRDGTVHPFLGALNGVRSDYDGSNVVQSVRFLGIDGPRWFLRVVVSGDGAFSGDIAAQIDELIASFVVHRGDEPMADGEPLPVVLPNGN